ncbi:MAG: hypothetical protein K6F91_02215 [Ruminococcus sp.]|nr:hypothetical protein [Ruminococcus sp.]
MSNTFYVNLAGKELRLYSLTCKSDCKITETPTLDTGIIRRLTGIRKNFYTLKGRMPFPGYLHYANYISSHIGTAVPMMILGSTLTLTLTKGEFVAAEEGMCEFTIELEEVDP